MTRAQCRRRLMGLLIALPPLSLTAFGVAGEALAEVQALSSAAAPVPRPPADIPLDHWSYPLLERLVARGILDLDVSSRPISRTQVAEALRESRLLEASAAAPASSGSGPAAAEERQGSSPVLSDRERWIVDRLEAEFLRHEVDRPAFQTRSGAASLALGFTALTQLRYGEEAVEPGLWPGSAPGGVALHRAASDEERDVGVDAEKDGEIDAATDVTYELYGGIDDLLGFYADTQVLFGGQDGARKVRLSSRVRTWRGIAVSSERAYVKLERPSFSVALGRRGEAWGRARWGRLMLSGSAPTFDQANVRYQVGALRLEALHSFLEYSGPVATSARFRDQSGSRTRGATGSDIDRLLDEGEQLYLAAHRIVLAGARGSIGLSEAVVYSSVMPDPAYINPLLPYYLSQHNERANDNVLWALDFDYRPHPGVEVWGEFLVDDLQYERTTGHPDKYGVTLGAAWYGSALDYDVELTGEYTNVRKWTYTHGVGEHAFAQDGLPIGFELGPDADRFTAELVAHPAMMWSVGLTYQHARKGTGTIYEPFEAGDSPEPAFPSGVVEETSRFSAELGYQSLERLSAGLGAAVESIRNAGNILGTSDEDFEVWIGVKFRI
ncbi:MAG: hypothetical protein JXB46_01225 [Candidatus Eisenbacteria bacterium]|nr:hypothetical protein [Candidatus Eisenbacteria bacterium]